jgi:hypothetical protein
MFIAALFTISKVWKQPRCLTTDEWIKEIWYLYTIEFYLATKRNEILSFACKWTELEDIIFSEVGQVQKAKNYLFSDMWNIDLIEAQLYYEKQVTLREGYTIKG